MLRDGPSTPKFVESMLSMFGNNPHGNPNFRLIWSERKMIYFAGDISPEYVYLNPPGWVLETWTPPEKDAGPKELWNSTTRGVLGPYPAQGTYNFVKQYPLGWIPTEENARLICIGLNWSKDVEMKDRVKAIRENKEAEAKEARQKVADEIVELQDSASRGLITQPASGKKNNFRTTDDYVRDQERAIPVDLPKSGGKIY